MQYTNVFESHYGFSDVCCVCRKHCRHVSSCGSTVFVKCWLLFLSLQDRVYVQQNEEVWFSVYVCVISHCNLQLYFSVVDYCV